MDTLSKKLFVFGKEPAHWCPGCRQLHIFNVYEPNSYSNAIWTWDGNVDRPTFSPSMNIVGRCHYFLKDGKIQFLSDCKHELASQTIDLPDLPDHFLPSGDGQS